MPTDTAPPISDFCRRLEPVGRVLEDPDYNVWGCSPIYGPDGRVHVFYARWKNVYHHEGWVTACEVGHAVSKEPNQPGGPYDILEPALVGTGGDAWDAHSIHNPTVYKVGDRYALFYMGAHTRDAGVTRDDLITMTREEVRPHFVNTLATKRVGLAVADDLNGPWRRVTDEPIIPPGAEGTWDDFVTSNPAYVRTPEGKHRLYYKAWNNQDMIERHGNRKYGFAESDNLEGPYTKHPANPVIDFSHLHPDMQVEDAYIWHDGTQYCAVLRDMGFYNHEYGLFFTSQDGIAWSETPEVAYKDAPTYFDEKPNGLDREGRFERPQILMKNDRPDHLFCAFRGGRYQTSSGVVFRVRPADAPA